MSKIRVMIAGLPGNMATLVAQDVEAQTDMLVYPYALAEESGEVRIDTDARAVDVRLIPMGLHEEFLQERGDHVDVIVDFTQPKSVNRNAELYCKYGIPFVMGTTGGDRDKLAEAIRGSKISALVTTNAAAQVVAVQEMIRFAAESFPGLFSGFELTIVESHQASKPDPSGTAVSLLPAFEKLGAPLSKDHITMVRSPVVQKQGLRIPEKHLGGHGYHTYTLRRPDGTVCVQVTHNILGRAPYVDGILGDIRFLYGKKGERGQVYTQIDQMRGGRAFWQRT